MIPLILRLVPKEVSPDGRKKVVHVLELKLAERMGLDELQQLAASQTQPLALPAPDENDAKSYFFPDVPDDEKPAEGEVVDITEDLAGDLEAKGEIPDQLDQQIADLQAALGYTKAQMVFRWNKVGGDKAAMVGLLTEEYNGNGKRQSGPKPHKAPPSGAPTTPSDTAEESNAALAAPKQTGWLI